MINIWDELARFLSVLISNWLPEIIAILIWTFIIWIMDFLPDNLKFHRRFRYMLKVKKAVCEIKVSIPLRGELSIQEVERIFNTYWDRNTINVRVSEGVISFFSKKSSSHFEIRQFFDDTMKTNFLTIDNLNGCNLGIFGGIKNLEETMDELQKISELFSAEKNAHQTITSEFSITPRLNHFLKSRLKGEFNQHPYQYSFTAKNILIRNKGFSELKKNISRTVYDWMGHFI
jgi:hypothetical protein